MPNFKYKNNLLHAEEIDLASIAEQFDTPCYVYSRMTLENNWHEFNNAFGDTAHRICYAVKANSNIAILNLLARLGSGFDIVSLGELERVLAAGGDPKKIVFSGVGKKIAEIKRALEIGIHCFNVESEAELERINFLAEKLNCIAAIALRVNPNIDAKTHPYISTGLKENKFGIEIENAVELCEKISSLSNVKLIGIACHIGSQLTDLSPFVEAIGRVMELANQLQAKGIALQHLNLGGGLGVNYRDEEPPHITDYVNVLRNKLGNCPFEIIIEPGRAITANTGVLLTRVEYIKENYAKNFAIVDAAMNDLVRPALYEAWQKIIPVRENNTSNKKLYDIVGPVCETADFLGKDRELDLQQGELLAICSSGAYGFSMSSNYNSRPKAAEILVDGNKVHLIREREKITDLFSAEKIIF